MRGALARQSLLSENLANVNTPGYQRRDLDFRGVLAQAVQRGSSVDHVDYASGITTSSAAMRPDGNSVDPDVEGAELASNGLEYSALVKIYHARNEILREAIGRR